MLLLLNCGVIELISIQTIFGEWFNNPCGFLLWVLNMLSFRRCNYFDFISVGTLLKWEDRISYVGDSGVNFYYSCCCWCCNWWGREFIVLFISMRSGKEHQQKKIIECDVMILKGMSYTIYLANWQWLRSLSIIWFFDRIGIFEDFDQSTIEEKSIHLYFRRMC